LQSAPSSVPTTRDTEPGYPKFFSTHLGLSSGAMKTLDPDDMEALCAAFRRLTGMSVLGPDRIADLWRKFEDKYDAPSR
jgi:hypothetical protein